MSTRDITVGATRRKLDELGYAIASADDPGRFDTSHWSTVWQKKSLFQISAHPAAILSYPTAHWAPEFENEPDAAMKRGVVLLVITAFLQSDPRQLKAAMSVLDRYKLTSGPVRTDNFGNKTIPVQWNSPYPLWSGSRGTKARETHPDDDATVFFQQAIPHERFQQLVSSVNGSLVQRPLDEIGSHILQLDGDWKGGHVLDTPRRNLPELFECDVSEIVGDVERARWGARPLALAKDAA